MALRTALGWALVVSLGPSALGSNVMGSGRNPAEFVLINGNILTMDRLDRVVSGVRIRDGRFVEVGDEVVAQGSEDQVIDLGGRTVTPGLIDTHIHYFRDAHVPGHLLSAIEQVFTIPDLLSAVTERAATVPAGEFITVLGRFTARQFAENRLPTLAELDAASPSHPVYLHQGFDGPAVTNTRGREYFQAHGVNASANGVFDRGQTDAPVQALFAEFTNGEALRTVSEYMRFAASMGLTTVLNYSGCGGFGRLAAGTMCAENFLDLWQWGGRCFCEFAPPREVRAPKRTETAPIRLLPTPTMPCGSSRISVVVTACSILPQPESSWSATSVPRRRPSRTPTGRSPSAAGRCGSIRSVRARTKPTSRPSRRSTRSLRLPGCAGPSSTFSPSAGTTSGDSTE